MKGMKFIHRLLTTILKINQIILKDFIYNLYERASKKVGNREGKSF